MKQSTKLIIMLALAIICAGTYFWWQATPLRSFEEAATAIKTHNSTQFNEYVDEQSLINGLLDDLVFTPIVQTTWANDAQRNAGREAAAMARPALEKALHRQLDAYVAGNTPAAAQTTQDPSLATSPDQSATVAENEAPPARGILGQILNEAKHELRSEVGRLKSIALANMQNHAFQHQDQLVCQLIASDRIARKSIIKERFQQYGFTAENFRGIAYVHEIPTAAGSPAQCVIGINFQSPETGGLVTPEVNLVQVHQFGAWRITRLANLHDLVTKLEPSYDHDLQEVALATLSGVTPEAALNELSHTTSRLLHAPAARMFIKDLKKGARKFGLLE